MLFNAIQIQYGIHKKKLSYIHDLENKKYYYFKEIKKMPIEWLNQNSICYQITDIGGL